VQQVEGRHEEPCDHFSATQLGATVASLHRNVWVYRSAYKCEACGASFTEVHRQPLEVRREGGAVG
jgi:hypothetical protein